MVYGGPESTHLYLVHLHSLFLAVGLKILSDLCTTIISVDGSVEES